MIFWNFVLNIAVLWNIITLPISIGTSNFSFTDNYPNIKYGISNTGPQKIINDSVGVDITAKSAISVDFASDAVLLSKNIDEQRSIASLTKLMSVLIVLDHNLPMDQIVKITTDDYREGGRFYLFTGEEVTVRELLYSMLIPSDNNATVAMAKATGLSVDQFVQKMNDKARELGMIDTNYVEPTGLDSRNVSTVKDLYILAKNLFSREIIQQITQNQKYSYRISNTGRLNSFVSTNMLLDSFIDIKAGKTGFSDEAGGCFAFLAANEKGNQIINIVLGADDQYARFQDGKSLTYWVFNNYIWSN